MLSQHANAVLEQRAGQTVRDMYYGNLLRDWLWAGGVAVAVFALLVAGKSVVAARLAAVARRTQNDWDDLFVELAHRTRYFFLAVVALHTGSRFVVLPAVVGRAFGGALIIAVVLQAALWCNSAVKHFVRWQVRRRMQDDAASVTTANAIGFVARVVLWSVLLLLGLDNLGIDVTALVAGLGVGGIAVALALQNVLGDLLANLSIVFDKPFVVGDFIIVDDMMGTIEHIGLKTTRVRSLSGEQIVFANTDLLKSRIRNYKRMYERRVVVGLGVTYDTPADTVARIPGIIRAIIEAQSAVRFDRAHFKGCGAFSLDFEAVYYVLDPDYNLYMDVQQAIGLAILSRFSAEGIEFAFPTQSLYLHRVREAVPAG